MGMSDEDKEALRARVSREMTYRVRGYDMVRSEINCVALFHGIEFEIWLPMKDIGRMGKKEAIVDYLMPFLKDDWPEMERRGPGVLV